MLGLQRDTLVYSEAGLNHASCEPYVIDNRAPEREAGIERDDALGKLTGHDIQVCLRILNGK